jgi:hypothetical protein
VKLNPTIPPGRSNRKARAYSAEIARLHREGYGCKAIHQALVDAGALVSRSTVQRELARQPVVALAPNAPTPSSARPVATQGLRPEVNADLHAAARPIATTDRPTGGTQSSRAFAAEFMKGCITNPLIRNRSQ